MGRSSSSSSEVPTRRRRSSRLQVRRSAMRAAGIQHYFTTTTAPQEEQQTPYSVSASLPSSATACSSHQQRRPLASVNHPSRTQSRQKKKTKRPRSSTTSRESQSAKTKRRHAPWDACSTDVDDDDQNQNPAAANQTTKSGISTVTPSSSAPLSKVGRATPASLEAHRLELESNQSASSTCSSSTPSLVLPPGVVDLYPPRPHPQPNPPCRCGEDHNATDTLTAAYLSTYGKEYADYLRASGAPVVPPSCVPRPTQHDTRLETCDHDARKSHQHDDHVVLGILPLDGNNHNDLHKNTLVHKPNVTPHMRAILVDWLIDLSDEYRLAPVTLHLAVSLLDRVLAKEYFVIEQEMLQCLGCACMMIAAKLEEVNALTVHEFAFMSDNTFTPQQIADMELQVCEALHFCLQAVTPYHYLEELVRASYGCTTPSSCRVASSRSYHQFLCLCLYMLELGLLPYELQQLPPKKVAAAAVYLARATLGRMGARQQECAEHAPAVWTKTLQYYSGYSVCQMEDTVRTLHGYHGAAGESRLKAVYNKYKSDMFLNIALRVAVPADLLGL